MTSLCINSSLRNKLFFCLMRLSLVLKFNHTAGEANSMKEKGKRHYALLKQSGFYSVSSKISAKESRMPVASSKSSPVENTFGFWLGKKMAIVSMKG